ncbi:hypothetical protein L323_04380 [Ruminiclostridium papyrosolvens C7]|uniref:Uncharacterized protein n=1 Tax=Ruminiclostridium papyrosolvens C7 TaxID=1330534 RepID=U4R4L9_9FIRM|nr:hypothetical protein L323_04380 [Ruminiclostridium papyrosolvens C7]
MYLLFCVKNTYGENVEYTDAIFFTSVPAGIILMILNLNSWSSK